VVSELKAQQRQYQNTMLNQFRVYNKFLKSNLFLSSPLLSCFQSGSSSRHFPRKFCIYPSFPTALILVLESSSS
jgi:hypothetical protein